MLACSFQDIEIMARTLFGEARGEPEAGQIGVADVILARSIDPRWPKTVTAVCCQRMQFSCWNDTDVPNDNTVSMKSANLEDPQFLQCLHVAVGQLSLMRMGQWTSSVKGANHYLNVRTLSVLPSWWDPAKITMVIGHHTFARL